MPKENKTEHTIKKKINKKNDVKSDHDSTEEPNMEELKSENKDTKNIPKEFKKNSIDLVNNIFTKVKNTDRKNS